ncbi:MAG: hypothetical protein PHX27_00570 [Candidatus ainarchaeum sp.]|nr:hypothetical protein [Candidatus ainarchaeum sp.]
MGGACLSFFVAPSEVNSVCMSNNLLSGLTSIPVIGLLIPFTPWVSLFYWFAPILGFVFAFFGITWWNNYFKTKEASGILFVIVILLFLVLGHFITTNWYYSNITLSPQNNVQYGLHFCFDNNPISCNEFVNNINQEYISQYQSYGGSLKQLILIDFWATLRKNIFLTFILGAIIGWIPFFVKRIIADKK